MAIWNYRAELVPREWIIREYGEIPTILFREETIEMAMKRDPNCLEQEDESQWAGLDFPADFIARAEAILPANERSPGYVCCGPRGSHRIELWMDGERPDLIGILLNLTQPDIHLFKQIADYALHLDTLIVPDDRFTTVSPELEYLLADIRESRAYRFCCDSSGTLQQIASKPAGS